MSEKRVTSISGQIVFVTLVLMIATAGWAQDHDLVMVDATDVTSSNSADWKSPDLKIGADFLDTSVPDIIRRGVPNSVYARFRINGIQDYTIPSGGVKIKLYWRDASTGTTPPDLSDSSWNSIGELSATYTASDGPFAITRIWPTDFPSVTTKSLSWTPLASGDYYHIAADVNYTSTTIDDENPDDNIVVSLYESQSGLLDVVLLLDTSGSMGYFTYGGYTYMELAKEKAAVFVDSMNDDHRFAVVAFDSFYSGDTKDVYPTPTASLVYPDWNNNKLKAVLEIGGLSAGWATPLGAGLDRAIQVLTTPLIPDRKRVILLISDGYENSGTPRACPPSYPTGTCVGGTIVSQLQTHNIKVFPISLGTAAWDDCLECLADESGGEWVATPNAGIALMEDLLALQQVYTGDDLYRVDIGISGGGNDVYSTYFEGVDDVLYFILSWDDLEAQLDLELGPPGGSWSPPEKVPNASVRRGKSYVVVRVSEPAIGTWGYRVTGESGKDYLVAVRSNHVGVRLEMDVKSEAIAGGFIEIHAHLADGMEPVIDANLVATVQVPVEASLETILRDASRDYMLIYRRPPAEPAELDRNPDISSRGLFIQKIMGDRREPLVYSRSVNVSLEHTGNGFYSGVLDNAYTTTAGVYQVTVKCSERRFDRNFSRELRLDPGRIDYEGSYAELFMLRQTGGESLYLLRVCPVDRFGNAITDPSLLERVEAEITGVRLLEKPEILYGSYQQELRIHDDREPTLVMVTIDGRKVKIR